MGKIAWGPTLRGQFPNGGQIIRLRPKPVKRTQDQFKKNSPATMLAASRGACPRAGRLVLDLRGDKPRGSLGGGDHCPLSTAHCPLYYNPMPFTSRLGLKRLAGLCRRLATALGAGIEVRTVWAREAERASGRAARQLHVVSRAINRGDSLADAMAATGSFFPPMFRELAEVGERTGHLAEVFAQLAEHYENQARLRRNFLAAITWPMTELLLAVVIVGLLIWVMGIIQKTTGSRVDPLGLNLIGNSGLLIYAAFLTVAGLAVFAIIQAARGSIARFGPIQRALLRLPVLGKALETLALARLAWSMHLTLNTGMDVRAALKLSLRSTRNARFTGQIPQIDAEIGRGNSIYEAFYNTGSYPTEFLDAVAVGHESGKLVESMGRLSGEYQDRARTALATLTKLAGVAVWVLIASIIIALIFRLAMFYIGTINSFL